MSKICPTLSSSDSAVRYKVLHRGSDSSTGKWQAGLYVNHQVARQWNIEESLFVQKAADQIWDSIERTRFIRALRSSEGQLRLAVDLANMGVLACDYVSQTVTLDTTASQLYDLPATFRYLARMFTTVFIPTINNGYSISCMV